MLGKLNMQPINQAVTAGNLPLLKWLLTTNGGELRRRLENRQIQHYLGLGAAGSPQVVEYLCEAQADPNERMPSELTEMGEGAMSMMEGMYNEGSKDVMVAWLANFKGATPLHQAAFTGNFSVARALCKSKADPTLTNGRGVTPVQLALDRGLNHIAAELEVHIEAQAAAKASSDTASTAASDKLAPKASAPKASAAWPAWSSWSFSSLFASTICCTAADTEGEVPTLVPVEVPGFAMPSSRKGSVSSVKRASKESIASLSTEASSEGGSEGVGAVTA